MARPLDHEELESLRVERAHSDLWDRETVDRIFATIDALRIRVERAESRNDAALKLLLEKHGR